MAPDAIAEVDGPGKRGGLAVCVVGQPRHQAAEAPHRNSHAKRQYKQVSSSPLDPAHPLHDLHAQPAAQQAPDNRLAPRGEQQSPHPPAPPRLHHRGPLLCDSQQAAAHQRPDRRGGKHGPALRLTHHVALPAALPPKHRVARRIGKSFHHRMPGRVRTDGNHCASIAVGPPSLRRRARLVREEPPASG